MARFTIKRLMILVSLAAALLTIYRLFWPNFLALFFIMERGIGWGAYALYLVSLSMTVGIWLLIRRRPRLAAWSFAISALLSSSSVALTCVYLYSIAGIVLMTLLSSLTIPLVMVCGIAWVQSRTTGHRLPNPAAWLIVLTFGLLPLMMTSQLWPLRLSFAISRPSMDRLAERIAAGEVLTAPEWAGLYRIVHAKKEPRNGNIALIIDASASGMSGFVRFAGPLDSFGPMINLNFNEPMGGRWFYQNED